MYRTWVCIVKRTQSGGIKGWGGDAEALSRSGPLCSRGVWVKSSRWSANRLPPDCHRDQARARPRVVRSANPQVARPAEDTECTAAEESAGVLLPPDSEGCLGEAEVQALPLFHGGDESGVMDSLPQILIIQPEDGDAHSVREDLVHVGTRVHRVSDPGVEVREVQDQDSPGREVF